MHSLAQLTDVSHDTGARTPASDERTAVNTPAHSSESQPTASVATAAELRYKVQFTADQAYVDLLLEARNLLQHELSTRDIVAVQRRALELLAAEQDFGRDVIREKRAAKPH